VGIIDDEVARIPHTVVIETLETCSGFVQPRTRVYTYWDVDPDAPHTTYNPFNAESQDEQRRENEADAATSMFSDDSGFDQYLNDILEEMAESENNCGDGDTNFEAMPDVADEDGHALSHLEVEGEGVSINPVAADDSFISSDLIAKLAYPPRTSAIPPLVQRQAQSRPFFALQHHRLWDHSRRLRMRAHPEHHVIIQCSCTSPSLMKRPYTQTS
jgi:hypothetical protein